MEKAMEDASSWISSPIKSSTWPVAYGFLDATLTYESSISDAVDVSDKTHLILRRPNPDSGPCEITISFAQQHEIRQVYVRSTARIYEIYCAFDNKNDNEYLCTVQCGVAAKNEAFLKATDVEGSISTCSNVSDKCLEEGVSKTESGSSTNEDGWVDVKAPDSPVLSNGNDSISEGTQAYIKNINKDFYEATAEISDANPCNSLTLRLLSIQSGRFVYVDEVYVFADPVVSNDVDSPSSKVEDSSGNAFMSMLIPTLLQLSKSRTRHVQDRNVLDRKEGKKHEDAELKLTGPAATYGHQKAIIETVNCASVQPTPSQFRTRAPNMENMCNSTSNENNNASSNIERILEALVSRVARIEDTLLRFEENIMKPMTSMEARLKRVERQFELVTKNSQSSLTSCNRISAPEFSFNSSESNSLYDDGNDYPYSGILSHSFKKDDCPPGEESLPSSDASLLAADSQHSGASSAIAASQLLPALVVTAPEFSYLDDEVESDTTEEIKDSEKANTKKPVSIDDALASALAGFLSSSADSKPDGYPSEERNVTETETADVNNLAETSYEASSSERREFESALVHAEMTGNVVELGHLQTEGGGNEQLGTCVYNEVDRDEKGATDDTDSITDGDGATEVIISNCAEYADRTILVNGNQTSDMSTVASEAGGLRIDSSEEQAVEAPNILHNVLKLTGPSKVDFETPILDVKFISQENSGAVSPLESLMGDTTLSNIEVPHVNERCTEQMTVTVDNQLVDLDNNVFQDSFLNAEEGLQDSPQFGLQDMSESLI